MKNSNIPGDGQTLRVSIPPGRDPFVNTPLISLGNSAGGEERFWISSWNSVSGTIGVLITESGEERIYRFEPPHSGFYSAALEDEDTLWLCGDLSHLVRLTLSSGATEVFETGAPSALVFAGMIIDHATGKLYAAAFPPSGTTAVSFDYKNRRTVKVYENICDEHYMRAHFPNGDGTYSSVMYVPGLSVMHWNPQVETLEKVLLHEQVPTLKLPVKADLPIERLISNEQGEWYFPECGWYHPQTRQISTNGPRPEMEMSWFGRRGNLVWGVGGDVARKVVRTWNLESGEIRTVCNPDDIQNFNVTLTATGKIVTVSIYGEFSRYDGETGALEISKRLPTDSVAHVDCLLRIDENRLLGTPFITQRFWEVDLQTGQGYDCGRAAPGSGEVLQTWKIGGRIYMAAYTGGELTEYDPNRHPHFPENPRVVAKPPGGMRPVAAADDGGNIYYSCTHKYGNLGCVLTKYDTATGLASYFENPLPDQAIRSLHHIASTQSLLAGTTRQADCWSAPATSPTCFFARLDADDLTVLEQGAAPDGTNLATVRGVLADGEYLCDVSGVFDGEEVTRCFVLKTADFAVPELSEMETYPDMMSRIIATGKPGLFVAITDRQIELFDMRIRKSLAVLHPLGEIYHVHVQDDSVYFVAPKEVIVLENCLAGY